MLRIKRTLFSFDIGRICVKLAGRDAGKKCVIVDVLKDGKVLIDGEVRRRPCSLKHLEPLKETIEIKKGADHAAVAAAFKELGIELREKKSKEKTERPRKVRKVKEKPAEEKKEEAKVKTEKKAEKKVSKKEEKKEEKKK